MKKSFLPYLSLFFLYACSPAKQAVLPDSGKHLLIMHDQRIREFPASNPTYMIIPGIYLPLQKKAFQLDRTQEWDRKILVLKYSETDDSSVVQIMANRFGYNNLIYTDTLLSLKNLQEKESCFSLAISTIKNKQYGLIPQLEVVPVDCNSVLLDELRDRYLMYDISTGTLSGPEKRIFRKKGYDDLFRRFPTPNKRIIKVSEIKNEVQ
jgi:hypothetical protein